MVKGRVFELLKQLGLSAWEHIGSVSPLLVWDCVSSRPPSCPPSGSERSLLLHVPSGNGSKGSSLSVEDRPAQGAGYIPLRANICTVWAPLDQGLPVGILSLLLRSASFRLPPVLLIPGGTRAYLEE